VDPQTALIVAVTAAVLGQVLGASLTVVGGLVNDHLASRRDERRERRELQLRRAQWEREDRVQRGREAREAIEKRFQERSAVYKQYLVVTASPFTLGTYSTRMDYLAALDSSFMDVLFICTDSVRSGAERIYEAARKLALLSTEGADQERLEEELFFAKDEFFEDVRVESATILEKQDSAAAT
jgi:hypothetical protein